MTEGGLNRARFGIALGRAPLRLIFVGESGVLIEAQAAAAGGGFVTFGVLKNSAGFTFVHG